MQLAPVTGRPVDHHQPSSRPVDAVLVAVPRRVPGPEILRHLLPGHTVNSVDAGPRHAGRRRAARSPVDVPMMVAGGLRQVAHMEQIVEARECSEQSRAPTSRPTAGRRPARRAPATGRHPNTPPVWPRSQTAWRAGRCRRRVRRPPTLSLRLPPSARPLAPPTPQATAARQRTQPACQRRGSPWRQKRSPAPRSRCSPRSGRVDP